MTNKTLIIAEKPSVAGDLAKALPGKFKKTKTHYESDSYVVSYAIGHLVSICYPEEINPAYQKWDMNTLPILPEEFPLKGLEGTKAQLNVLQKLIRRKDITEIINACDAGREGELIFKYIVKYVWNNSVAKKSFKRLWLQSMTTDAIKSAFATLRDNEDMTPLEDTALCRSESDWLIGINATRALTGFNSRRGGFFLTPCGRVQTPTLSLLVKRERARHEFIAKPFWTLHATFDFLSGAYEGKWIDTAYTKDPTDAHKKADRLWDAKDADALIQKCTGKAAVVTEETKKTSQSSPPLYDLTLLQREANSRFGFSAKNTLGIAQALYERHKVLTYPRTDSKHLPEDYLPTVKKTIENQTKGKLKKFARLALDKNYVVFSKKIFDNSKISDHHAIIPTNVLPSSLSEPEEKIYTLVVQRFLAVFFPSAEYLNTKRYSVVENETFLTEGKILLEAGWKSIYGTETGDGKDKILTQLPDNAKVLCEYCEKEQHETTPPARFNEATLLSAMENSDKLVADDELADAMKERGLGTPATRAAIIEKLINEKYVVREGKDLTPTGKAFELLSLLEAMKIEVLASPEMTGEWEYKLNQILKGDFTREKFMDEIRSLTRHIIDQVKNFEADEVRLEAPFSPVNGIHIFCSPTAYISADEKISIRKILGGRMLSDSDVIALLNGETIGPYSDFRSKRGKPFTASVKLVNNKIEFMFADSMAELDIEAIKKSPSLGFSPIDGTKVFDTPMAYLSESALDGETKKGLRISKIILSKEITAENIKQLLTDGKTELITGFISKRRKPFEAYLILAKNGTVSFEFPPRKTKPKE
ncbi:DNA topoisomerase III [Desulforhopalus sp. IMCC35007]|uniref:DNA topoisomerase III n=1 Tax=Desulforhopalus sp. IMCC35007 TaxID=2569543 RepID=UPI0010AE36DB|nr:DNA topoisomerase III [Desulforhopalus sp. IMCC35007]TKB10643.1 DNA topoisomerase III [Desulforhopalus sp. IMCC35007]